MRQQHPLEHERLIGCTADPATARAELKRYLAAALLLGLLRRWRWPRSRALSPSSDRSQGSSNESCLACHAEPSLSMLLQNGEELSLFIDSEAFAQSVHGQAGYACVQCHTDLPDTPTPAFRRPTAAT